VVPVAVRCFIHPLSTGTSGGFGKTSGGFRGTKKKKEDRLKKKEESRTKKKSIYTNSRSTAPAALYSIIYNL
jgi:hypothetical protein